MSDARLTFSIRNVCLIAGSLSCLLAIGAFASNTPHVSNTSKAPNAIPDAVWGGNQRVRDVLVPTTDFTKAEKFELMQGGAGTQQVKADRNAYSMENGTLGFEGLQSFKLGNALFNKFWVASPSSTQASDGLGPFYNARACQSCHIKDGRGQLPVVGEKTASLLLQLKNENAGWGPDPAYGGQLHTSAVPGVKAEGLVDIIHKDKSIVLNGEDPVILRAPSYQFRDLAYGQLDANTHISARLAPAMSGLGLLEAIDASHILAYADPDDSDGDGISGRANWEVRDGQEPQLGRFGHKASTHSVRSQNVHALFSDMGLSSAEFPDPQGDCASLQTFCNDLPHGDQARLGKGEAPAKVVDLITFYAKNLAVPARREVEGLSELAGKELFYGSGCISCHTPKHVTARDASQDELQFQLIWPYTDLLLHDMGDALADNAGDGAANGREWRTAPLWGIGLAQVVNPNTSFLHDGRARTLLEAVLWHGGEAQPAQEAVVAMTPSERQQLVLFLESL